MRCKWSPSGARNSTLLRTIRAAPCPHRSSEPLSWTENYPTTTAKDPCVLNLNNGMSSGSQAQRIVHAHVGRGMVLHEWSSRGWAEYPQRRSRTRSSRSSLAAVVEVQHVTAGSGMDDGCCCEPSWLVGLDFCVDTGSIRFTSAMVGLDAAELSSVRTWFVLPCVLGWAAYLDTPGSSVQAST